MEPPPPSAPLPPPPSIKGSCPLSIEPIRLPPDVLRTLPEVQRWVASPAVAAWGAPYAPTLTAAAGLAAGGCRLPSLAVPSLGHAVTVDTCVWLQGDGKGEPAAACGSCAGGTLPMAAGYDDNLGTPVGVKSMMYVPVATPDGATVLGVTVTEEMISCTAGLGRSGSVGTLGRWVLFPAEGVLAFACGTEDGRHVLFGTFHPEQAESTYVMSLLRRPTTPGGDPYLISRLSTLSQRVDDGADGPPTGVAGGGGARAVGGPPVAD